MKKLLSILLLAFGLTAQTIPTLPLFKAVSESFDVSVDFTPAIGSGGAAVVSVTAQDTSTNQPTPQIIATSPAPGVVGSTDVVGFRLQGGQVNHAYLVTVIARNVTSGETWEGQINVTINGQ